MVDEKNLIKNPAKGEIIASSSNVKGKEVERISEGEINQQINNISQLIERNTGKELVELENQLTQTKKEDIINRITKAKITTGPWFDKEAVWT